MAATLVTFQHVMGCLPIYVYATDHETSLDFSSLGRQKNHPFQLRFEDADWLNFMSHLEYIYILNQDLTKFYKDPPPVGDFSIAPQLKLRRADRQRGHIVMVKTYIFHRRFSNISHHTKIHLNYLYNYYFVCVVQGGRRPSALYWPAATGTCATDPISIFVFALRELQGFLAYLLQQVLAADVHLHSQTLQSFLFCSIYSFFYV